MSVHFFLIINFLYNWNYNIINEITINVDNALIEWWFQDRSTITIFFLFSPFFRPSSHLLSLAKFSLFLSSVILSFSPYLSAFFRYNDGFIIIFFRTSKSRKYSPALFHRISSTEFRLLSLVNFFSLFFCSYFQTHALPSDDVGTERKNFFLTKESKEKNRKIIFSLRSKLQRIFKGTKKTEKLFNKLF